MNPCLPHPVGDSNNLKYTLSGLTEAQLVAGVSVSFQGATLAVDNTTVTGAVIKDASDQTVDGVSVKATGTFTLGS